MTKKQFTQKIRSLINQDREWLVERSLRLFNSGAINTYEYKDDFFLPKIVYCAALKDLIDDRMPMSDKGREEFKALSNF